MFRGPDDDPARPNSRVLKPPGGDSNSPVGCSEDVSIPLKPHKMSSSIFGAAEEPQNIPKRTNPPGGKESGIFEGHKANPFRQLTNPPGGKTSNIFGSPEPFSTVKAHPNKPKDHNILSGRGDAPQQVKPQAPEDQRPKGEDVCKKSNPEKESPKDPGPKIDDHEPRLGPLPRSHNKVLNPPGGKSSIAFY